MDKTTIFLSPMTRKPLQLSEAPLKLFNEEEAYASQDDVIILLKEQSPEYEGSYLNKINYTPRKDYFPFTIPLWMISNGYLWEVRKQFSKSALICELGCASGVNYFGNEFTMIGLDLSFKSLQGIDNYEYKIQADALSLPFKNGSLDGIINSYFWEHITPHEKKLMLKEFYRVLKPGGKIVMLYDVETRNGLIEILKKDNLEVYESLFLHGDYHVGYETMEENELKFKECDFKVLKHFGMERTFFQSSSVYIKLSRLPSFYGAYAKVMKWVFSSKITNYINILFLRILDETLGKYVNVQKSRIAISVLQK